MSLLHYNHTAGIPAHVQLEEQVKVALALGRLRPGDLLPSIRQVEDQIGVGRMLVRKAYQQLQDAGLVRVVHGRGAVVTGQGRANGHVAARVDALIEGIVADLRRERLNLVTFARMFHQRMLAEDARAPGLLCVDSSEVLAREVGEQIQQALGVHVRTMGLARLRRERASVTSTTQVLVDYYYLPDVRRILKGRAGRIYPISWDYDPAFLQKVLSLPLGSRVLLLFFAQSLKEQGTLLAIEALLERLRDRDFRVDVRPVEPMLPLGKLRRSRYAAVVVSNRVWDEYGTELERSPETFWRLSSRLNQQSLDSVRDRLGLVL